MGQCASYLLIHEGPSPTDNISQQLSQRRRASTSSSLSLKQEDMEFSVLNLEESSQQSIHILIKLRIKKSLQASMRRHNKDICISTSSDQRKDKKESTSKWPVQHHHRQLSEKIESCRSLHKLKSASKTGGGLLKRNQVSTDSQSSWLNLTCHGISTPKPATPELQKTFQETNQSCDSWGALTVQSKFCAEATRKMEREDPLDLSMNDISGNTLPSRLDASDPSLDCDPDDFRCTVRPLTEDRPKELPLPALLKKSPSQKTRLEESLSSVQLRKKRVQLVVDHAIDEYSRSFESLKDSMNCSSAARSCKSDTALELSCHGVAPQKDNLACLRKEPWNPHNLRPPAY